MTLVVVIFYGTVCFLFNLPIVFTLKLDHFNTYLVSYLPSSIVIIIVGIFHLSNPGELTQIGLAVCFSILILILWSISQSNKFEA